jgi:hypothetical protein
LKVVILNDGEISGKGMAPTGFDLDEAANNAFNNALENAGIQKDDIKHITSTGAGKKEIDFRDDEVTEVGAAAKGATALFPSSRTIIEVGAEEGRALLRHQREVCCRCRSFHGGNGKSFGDTRHRDGAALSEVEPGDPDERSVCSFR